MFIEVKTTVNADAIANMLMTAIDNQTCIGHWCSNIDKGASQIPRKGLVPESVSGYPWYVQAAMYGSLQFVVPEHPARHGRDAGPRNFYLKLCNVVTGLEMLAEKSPKHFANVLKNETDIDNADVFLQYALFGEYIYA